MPRTPKNKGQKYPADVLTRGEIDALQRAQSGRSSIAIRNRALLAALHETAMRSAEVLDLLPHDVNLATGRVRIRRGKGKKPRTVWLDDDGIARLTVWLARRTELGFGDDQPLFCSVKKKGGGGKLDTSYLRRLFPRLKDRAELPATRHVHPHALRHTRATEMRRGGMPLPEIKAALGHSHLATTVHYLDHLEPEGLENSMRGLSARLAAAEEA